MLPKGSNAVARMTLLRLLPNGDWRDRSEVQVYLPPGLAEQVDMESMADDLTESLISALAFRRLRLHLWGRWLGQEEAFCDLAILEVVHGLFSAT